MQPATTTKFTPEQLADFKAYVEVQKSSRFNMFDPRARQAAGISRESLVFCMENYEALKQAAGAAA